MERMKLAELSEDYFGFMARAYPVMSLSDEFYFFPRANKAIQYINCLDSLNSQKIKQDIARIENLKISLEKLNKEDAELETQIDWQLLKASMAGFLQGFQQIRIWQGDPNLYLKIIILGIEQIVNKFSMIKTDTQEMLASRIKQIPRLLSEAKTNLKKIPLLYQETAIQMTGAIIDYLKNQLYLSLRKDSKLSELIKLNKRAIQSLEDFKGFLKRKTGKEEFIKDRRIIEEILASSFSYKRSLCEIFEIASDEYQDTKKQLKRAAKAIRPSYGWQRILSDYKLRIRNTKELLDLYSTQIINLKDFLIKSELISIPKMQDIRVEQTPPYLAPIRASASYSCPITQNRREFAFFYVSAEKPQENIHQEYIFVTAHETYPGHHLLDSIRRNIKNPIRQQIESPLFYEGWASYAERLIDEFGYLNNTKQRLIGLRRQAWRAIRAMLDVGIRINKIGLSDASRELRWLGYNPSSVKAMLKHYVLTYGYQLCYTIGKFEIERLKKRFALRMGIKNFHNCLLSGGELPFDLIEKRMERLCQKDS
jgi:hypothetical protein